MEHKTNNHDELVSMVKQHYPAATPKAIGMGFTIWYHQHKKVATWDAIEKVGTVIIPS